MIKIIWVLYLIMLGLYSITCFFIAYHIKKYSISATLNLFFLPVFILITGFLFLFNAISFLSVDWEGFFVDIPLFF